MKRKYIFFKIITGVLLNIILSALMIFLGLKFKIVDYRMVLIFIVLNLLLTIAAEFHSYVEFKKYLPKLESDYVTLNTGVFFQSYLYLPTQNIQSVKHRRSILERLFKLNTLILRTAGEAIKLNYLLDEEVTDFVGKVFADEA